jgi:hypothetical protein
MKSWSTRIEEAGNSMELLSVAREFLDSWEPEDLALLPETARPQRIKGVDDLSYWHQKLVESFCDASLDADRAGKVREMLHFFAFAVQRSVETEGVPLIDEHEAAAQLFSERSVPKLFTSAMSGVSTEH